MGLVVGWGVFVGLVVYGDGTMVMYDCVCVQIMPLIWKSKVSWSNFPNMFLPVLLPSPVSQNRSGTGCRMVRPWTAKREFRKAGT